MGLPGDVGGPGSPGLPGPQGEMGLNGLMVGGDGVVGLTLNKNVYSSFSSLKASDFKN